MCQSGLTANKTLTVAYGNNQSYTFGYLYIPLPPIINTIAISTPIVVSQGFRYDINITGQNFYTNTSLAATLYNGQFCNVTKISYDNLQCSYITTNTIVKLVTLNMSVNIGDQTGYALPPDIIFAPEISFYDHKVSHRRHYFGCRHADVDR